MSDSSLLHPRVLTRSLETAKFPSDLKARHERLQPLLAQLKSGELARTKETKLQGEFTRIVFGEILGYRARFEDNSPTWDIDLEQNVARKGRRAADGAIGWFRDGGLPTIHAVIEYKGASQSLDRAAGRTLTPVQQAWDYANETRSCRWILVSNYKETRLYHKGRSKRDVEVFHLADLEDEQAFKRFWLLLARDNLLPGDKDGHAPLDRLLEASDNAQLEITNQLYKEYAEVRLELFEDLCRGHSNRPPLEILRVTQKLLDRVLFVAFAEDRGLLPPDTIKRAITADFYERPFWDQLKQVFQWVDEGRTEKGFYPFNGGLFAPDEELDALDPSNATLSKLGRIARYDFSSDVSVEVLGHIFEQSITDLEELRAVAEGRESDALSKRKKHGVFYTPSYVTRYLVEQTLGRTMRERLEAIEAEVNPTKVRGKHKKNDAWIRVWETYRDSIRDLRVLDPACGSGAFLIAAFDFLQAEYETVNATLADLRGGVVELWDLTKAILNGNLFGVDLNHESVEITKLSLWLKTASKGNKLTWLDANIRCGDSIVSDPTVAPRAFDWSRGAQVGDWTEHEDDERQRVAGAWAGGFDVVIGNPPYVRQELLGPIKPHLKEHYRSWHGMADLFVYFFERGLDVLKPGGRLGFIVANKWMKGGYAAPLRRMLASETVVEEVIDFGHAPIFPDADAFPSILVVRKPAEGGGVGSEHEVRATVFPREELGDHSIAEFVESRAVSIPQGLLGAKAWGLEPPALKAVLEAMRQRGESLESFVSGTPTRGAVTGLNAAFVIDPDTRSRIVVEDPKSAQIIRPFVAGRDVSAWHAQWNERYVIFARRGIDIETYPGALGHLRQFRDRLEPKPADWTGARWPGRKTGNYKWYEIQDAADYWKEFEKPKLVFPDIMWTPSFAYDESGLFPNDTCFSLPTNDLWLAAVLNSPLMWAYAWRNTIHGKDEALRMKSIYVSQFPIPEPPAGHADEARELAAANVEATRANQQAVRDVLDWLREEHGVTKVGRTLPDLASLSAKKFVSEVKKRRDRELGTLTPKQLRELKDLHEATRLPILQRQQAIAKAERRLSDLVNQAFGLTAEDVDLVRRTAPPRMPPGLS